LSSIGRITPIADSGSAVSVWRD
jgi:hypothetical protein